MNVRDFAAPCQPFSLVWTITNATPTPFKVAGATFLYLQI